MEAYQTSSKVLRDLLSHPSLQRDNVERTMNRLSDALADHADIERAMAEEGELVGGVVGLSTTDDEEALDAELATLAMDDKQDIYIDGETAADRRVEIPMVGHTARQNSTTREPVAAS